MYLFPWGVVPASSAVPGIGPSLQKPFQEYLEAQRQKLHHRSEMGAPQVRLASPPHTHRAGRGYTRRPPAAAEPLLTLLGHLPLSKSESVTSALYISQSLGEG